MTLVSFLLGVILCFASFVIPLMDGSLSQSERAREGTAPIGAEPFRRGGTVRREMAPSSKSEKDHSKEKSPRKHKDHVVKLLVRGKVSVNVLTRYFKPYRLV